MNYITCSSYSLLLVAPTCSYLYITCTLLVHYLYITCCLYFTCSYLYITCILLVATCTLLVLYLQLVFYLYFTYTVAPTSAARGFQPQSQEAESIMLNVAGKLLMFQRDRSGPQVKTTKDTKDRISVWTDISFVHHTDLLGVCQLRRVGMMQFLIRAACEIHENMLVITYPIWLCLTRSGQCFRL